MLKITTRLKTPLTTLPFICFFSGLLLFVFIVLLKYFRNNQGYKTVCKTATLENQSPTHLNVVCLLCCLLMSHVYSKQPCWSSLSSLFNLLGISEGSQRLKEIIAPTHFCFQKGHYLSPCSWGDGHDAVVWRITLNIETNLSSLRQRWVPVIPDIIMSLQNWCQGDHLDQQDTLNVMGARVTEGTRASVHTQCSIAGDHRRTEEKKRLLKGFIIFFKSRRSQPFFFLHTLHLVYLNSAFSEVNLWQMRTISPHVNVSQHQWI